MRRHPLVACAAIALLAGCSTGAEEPGEVVVYNARPLRFAIDDTGVYWLDLSIPDEVTLYAGPLGAEPVDRIDLVAISATGYTALALDVTNIYFGTPDGVAAVPKTGGSPTAVVTGDVEPIDIVVDGSTVFWCTGGLGATLHWRDLADGPTTTVTMPDETLGLAVDADAVYVLGYVGLYRVSRTTQQVETLALAADYESLYPDAAPMYGVAMVLGSDHLDWIVAQIGIYADQNRGALIRVPLASGAPTVEVSGLLAPRLLRVDATGVRYWVESAVAHGGIGPTGIQRLAPGETTPTAFVENIAPSDTAIADGALYWSDSGEMYDYGWIRRLPLP